MDRHIDEAEHSGEMQYPYIAKAIVDAAQGRAGGERDDTVLECRVLPIMVGALGTSAERRFGRILAPYLSRPEVFTVVSSDFCHWGRRFGYAPNGEGSPRQHNEIAEYIEWLDRQGMNQIELQRPGAFADYLRTYSNTICGRHPIGVWLHALAANREAGRETTDVRFVRYAQSGRVKNMDESSVSYASAVARISMAS
uniref:Protein MEMO1 n=2 Tax=Odontella aurita TaxID=265563 RepID=A0A7S4HWQ8_9STRA|mmetsp:Transcript_16443/g.47255  ORF Transcript_16443/g.47255 Transcript_16443/m.47255 type:complete len:197 (+) Transcript_16443:1121-1711(+)